MQLMLAMFTETFVYIVFKVSLEHDVLSNLTRGADPVPEM